MVDFPGLLLIDQVHREGTPWLLATNVSVITPVAVSPFCCTLWSSTTRLT
jgi:hypothetical protein